MTNLTGFQLPAGIDVELTSASRNTDEERRLASDHLVRYIRAQHEKKKPVDVWEQLRLTSMLGLNVTPSRPGRE